MPAPSIRNILMYEAAVLSAWRKILQNAGIALEQLFVEFQVPASSVTPRIELNVVHSKPTKHLGEFLPGQFTFDAWNLELMSRVVTRRNVNGDQHDQLLSIVRSEALYFAARFTPDILPWHVMTKIEESDSQRSIDTTRDEDITEQVHSCIISVPKKSWPASE